jgi:hypothetical protein
LLFACCRLLLVGGLLPFASGIWLFAFC